MTAQLIVATVLALTLILFPVVFIWFPTIGGIVIAARERKQAKATGKARG
jgi:hypothetical protein